MPFHEAVDVCLCHLPQVLGQVVVVDGVVRLCDASRYFVEFDVDVVGDVDAGLDEGLVEHADAPA